MKTFLISNEWVSQIRNSNREKSLSEAKSISDAGLRAICRGMYSENKKRAFWNIIKNVF